MCHEDVDRDHVDQWRPGREARRDLGGIDRAAGDLRELGERAARRDIRAGYEALAWGRHASDHRDAWEIVRRADHPNTQGR